jgi:hypothetical protein
LNLGPPSSYRERSLAPSCIRHSKIFRVASLTYIKRYPRELPRRPSGVLFDLLENQHDFAKKGVHRHRVPSLAQTDSHEPPNGYSVVRGYRPYTAHKNVSGLKSVGGSSWFARWPRQSQKNRWPLEHRAHLICHHGPEVCYSSLD